MARPKKNPDYNPREIIDKLLKTVSTLYKDGLTLRQIGDEMDMDLQKVRKLICTANYRGMIVYQSDMANEIQNYYRQKKTVAEIMTLTGLSRASVQSYLPYIKVPYKELLVSANAERIRLFRERQKAVEKLKENPEILWDVITLFQGYPFRTVSGLRFRYTIKGGEMAVNRKEKTITRSSVELAYRKALSGGITGPKQLGVFGASYLYPVFVRIGVVSAPESVPVSAATSPLSSE